MISAYRLVKPVHADDPFSGEGSRLAGGRWNSPGKAVVYTSQNASLATLETLVNLIDSTVGFPEYMLVECLFHEGMVEEINRSLLPDDWYETPAPPILQALGDAWLISLSSAVLAVPSAIIPTETSYLLNPAHPDFTSIEIGLPRPFRLDLRLLG